MTKRPKRNYVGWIYIDGNKIFHFHPSVDKDGKTVKKDFICGSDAEAVRQADKWFDRRIKLQPTVNLELGMRIYLED